MAPLSYPKNRGERSTSDHRVGSPARESLPSAVRDQVSPVPLVLSLSLSLGGHVWFALQWDWWRAEEASEGGERSEEVVEEERAEVRLPVLGKPGEEERATVAFISHDAFEEMKARRAETLQPAVQREAEPVEAAPVRVDAATPMGAGDVMLTGGEVATPASEVAQRSDPLPPSPPVPRREVVEVAGPRPDPRPALAEAPEEAVPVPDVRPSPSSSSSSASGGAGSGEEDRLTSAARSESEATPTVVELDSPRVVVGRVLVSNGLEIHTVMPRFEGPTLASAWPGRLRVRLVFNEDGSVRDATLLNTSGYPAVDSPVQASLYRWTLTAESVQRAGGGPVEVPEITLIFSD